MSWQKILKGFLRVFEPWDLPEEWIDSLLVVAIYVYDTEHVFLLELPQEYEFKGRNIKYLVATRKSQDEASADYSLIATDNAPDSLNPLDVSWWRGDWAFVGELKIEGA